MTEQQRESDLELAMQMLEEYNEVFTEGKLDLQEIKECLLAETDREFKKSLSTIFVMHNLAQEKIRAREIIQNTYLDGENNYIANTFLERN